VACIDLGLIRRGCNSLRGRRDVPKIGTNSNRVGFYMRACGFVDILKFAFGEGGQFRVVGVVGLRGSKVANPSCYAI